MFKKSFEQGKTEHELKFKDNGYAAEDIDISRKRDLNHLWPLDIKILNSMVSEKANIGEDINSKDIMGKKYKARERFRSWLDQISDPGKDVNSKHLEKVMKRSQGVL